MDNVGAAVGANEGGKNRPFALRKMMNFSNSENSTAKGFADELAALRKQVTQNETRLAKSEIRLRVTWAVSFITTLAMLTIGWHKDALAQGYGMTLAQAATRIAALETKTASMSAITDPNTSQPTVRFTGVNVQVVSGKSSTDESTLTDASRNLSGLGNLIIGYNETGNSGGDYRDGCHNLILGTQNSYRTFGGLVAGQNNTLGGRDTNSNLMGAYATLSGGYQNTATGNLSSVGGGHSNSSLGSASHVSGGNGNMAIGIDSSVSGGSGNTATGAYSNISGGGYITQSFPFGFAAGGQYSPANHGPGTYHNP